MMICMINMCVYTMKKNIFFSELIVIIGCVSNQQLQVFIPYLYRNISCSKELLRMIFFPEFLLFFEEVIKVYNSYMWDFFLATCRHLKYDETTYPSSWK